MTLTTNATGDSITFASSGGSGSLALNDLTNVTTAPGNGDVLWYNAGNSRWEEGGYELSVADASTGDKKEIRLIKPSGSYSGSTGLISLDPGTGILLGRSGQTISITSTCATEAFSTVAVSGQGPLTADSAADTLTFVAGTGITLTTSPTNDSLTITSSGSGTEAFKTVAVSGQNNIVADSAADTLTFVAGTGIALTTSSTNDSLTISSSGSGSSSSGVEDADGDTKIQVEESPDEDKIRFDTAGNERMIIDRWGDIAIGSSSNPSASRVVINDIRLHGTASAGPPTALGFPMLQVGQEDFRAGGVYSIGMGYTASGYENPPVEIAAKTLSSSGGTTADIVFGTRSVTTNTAVTERVRILKTGGITFDGETTTPHALDDYQEGTYQVQFRSGSATSSTYVTAGTAGTGSYTKIGDIVHVSVPCQNINPSGLTSTGTLFISLPFVADITYLQFPCVVVNFATRAPSSMLGAYAVVQPGTAAATIVQRNSTNATETTLTVGDVLRTTQLGGAYTAVRFSVTYKTV
tara:strand:- start:7319 stop:8887 length:1569 start_codon:yes stop_codon:yes gene_type:complete